MSEVLVMSSVLWTVLLPFSLFVIFAFRAFPLSVFCTGVVLRLVCVFYIVNKGWDYIKYNWLFCLSLFIFMVVSLCYEWFVVSSIRSLMRAIKLGRSPSSNMRPVNGDADPGVLSPYGGKNE